MTEPRKITLSEVSWHNSRRNLWMVIHNDVLDLTSFVNEHPGGAQLLIDYAGTDATFAFEDVGHSHDARELAAQYKIGWLPPEERKRFKDTCAWKYALILLAAAVIAGIAYKKYSS